MHISRLEWFGLALNAIVGAVGVLILYTNYKFFETTRTEAIDTTVGNIISIATNDLGLRLGANLFVKDFIAWKMLKEKKDFVRNKEEFTKIMIPLMNSRPDLVTLYQGDTKSLDVLKFSKVDNKTFFVELRDHALQQRFRTTYTIADDQSLSSEENDVQNKSYDVRLKSWFSKGSVENAQLVDGPSFDSYVAKDINNPTAFSILFNMPRSGGDQSIYRLKYRTDSLKEAFKSIAVGATGKVFVVKENGVVVFSADVNDHIKMVDGVAKFKTIQESSVPILQQLTEANLGNESRTGLKTVLDPNNPQASCVISPLDLGFGNDLRVIIYSVRTDFSLESLKYYRVCSALGYISITLAFIRTIVILNEIRRSKIGGVITDRIRSSKISVAGN